ncbi:MAG: NAD(P)/FAD-dependent oxidoreductase [Pseudomonadota bacterium]
MTDAVVIGAGHNGLVCATLLAQAGMQVVCVEQADQPGGLARRRVLGDCQVPMAHAAFPPGPELVRELRLDAVGFQPGPTLDTIALGREGQHLTFSGDEVSGAALKDSDREAYRQFRQAYARFGAALRPLLLSPPPRLKNLPGADLKALVRLAWRLRFGLGREQLGEFLRVVGANMRDVLEDHFENPQLRGALAADAVRGHSAGPYAPGTVWTWLLRVIDSLDGPLSALAADELIRCLPKAAENAGVDLRLASPVANIAVADNQARGITLADGSTIEADHVVSSADPITTLSRLVGAPQLDAMFAHRVAQIRSAGAVARVHLVLSEAPTFTGLSDANLDHRLVFAPSVRALERAYNPIKYGAFSDEPALEIVFPTRHQPELAPAGQTVLSANVMYVPYRLKGGWTDARRGELLDRVLKLLDSLAPGLSQSVLSSECLTPADIESIYGVTGGHWHQGEVSLHQSLMLRPVYGAAQYATPVAGLYLCGAGCHPGGGVTGWPGRNAARQLLKRRGAA